MSLRKAVAIAVAFYLTFGVLAVWLIAHSPAH